MKNLKEFAQEKKIIIDREKRLAEGIEAIIAAEKGNKVIAEAEKINGLIKYVDEIYEKKHNLENDRFYVAITGAMNSGKSTLLNALLFEKDVLSVDATACTAKITFIEKSDKKEVEVKFYTKEEWEKWKEDAGQSSSIEAADFEKYKENGERHSDKLGKSEIVSESELTKYTATSGELMPLVNTITIKDNEVSLEGAQIVDTPGTNDPVAFRSKVAEDYIEKADAIIYVMYISEPLAKTDIDTLRDIIITSGKNADNIILVLNKKDAAATAYYDDNNGLYKTYPEFDQYLEHELGDFLNKYLKELGLSKCPHVFVCGTAARIAQEKKAGKELNKDMKERLEKLDDFIDRDNPEEILDFSGLNKFREQVEGYLIKNKDDSILGQHSRFTDEQKKKTLNVFKQEKDRFVKELEVRKDIDKLQSEINDKNNEIKAFEREKQDILNPKSFDKKKDAFIKDLNNSVLSSFCEEISRSLKSFDEQSAISKIERIKDAAKNNIEKSAENCTGKFIFKGDAARFEAEVKKHLESFRDNSKEVVDDILRNIRERVSRIIFEKTKRINEFLDVDFKKKLEEWNDDIKRLLKNTEYSTEYVVFPTHLIPPRVRDIVSGIKQDLDSKIGKQIIHTELICDKLNGIKTESDGILFGLHKNDAISKMKTELENYLELRATKDLKKYIKDFKSNLEEDLIRWVENYITYRLPESLWNITGDIFRKEFKEAADAINSRLMESQKDLQSIQDEQNLKIEEFEKKKSEINNKIRILEGYIGKIETL